jgi:thermitase
MKIEFYTGGRLNSLQAHPLARAVETAVARTRGPATTKFALSRAGLARGIQTLTAEMPQIRESFMDLRQSDERYVTVGDDKAVLIVTDAIIVEGATATELLRLEKKFGLEMIREGTEEKVLLRSKQGDEAGIQLAMEAAREAVERGRVRAAHPNFVRILLKPKPSTAGAQPYWNHKNAGNPGVACADVAAGAAWTITQGEAAIRVAVLDEGVDTKHPALKKVVVDQKDFVDGNAHALPDNDDAHGTACAGIISSQDEKHPGLARGCSLVAVRIAKGDGMGGWVSDDFNTADAIDWAWRDAKSDVLSNSWGGGPPVDAITNAIERARTQGRKGKGSVIAFASGNSDGAIQFPGTHFSILTVGASNQWDQRKSRTSKDGENWWGSCFGKGLDLVAPGVQISTTDISGARGYSKNDFIDNFNGTSSATPHAAAAAALILSLAPDLSEARVQEILTSTCDRVSPDGKWHAEFGYGRLNIFAALRLARR